MDLEPQGKGISIFLETSQANVLIRGYKILPTVITLVVPYLGWKIS